MSNDSGLQKLKDAFQRLKKGEPLIVPPGSKITIRNVEEEAGMGNGSAYYYPDFVDTVKAAKKESSKHGRRGTANTASPLSEKNKELIKQNRDLTAQNRQILIAQAELANQFFKANGGEATSSSYKSTVSALSERTSVK